MCETETFLIVKIFSLFVFSRYLRQECLTYKFSYDDAFPVARLISKLGNKMQVCTQRYDRRPYGVGLLVAGYDVSSNGHLYNYS